jgi:hypothetical protein
VADNYIFNRRGVRGALPRGRGVLDSFDFTSQSSAHSNGGLYTGRPRRSATCRGSFPPRERHRVTIPRWATSPTTRPGETWRSSTGTSATPRASSGSATSGGPGRGQTRTSPPSTQGRPEAQRLGARWVPKPPWFPGESRGIATNAQAREPVRLQGISAESGKHASRLPCRRSRVRVPSAARGKAPHLRGFLLLGALARPARFEGFSGRAALDLVRVALPAMARLAVRVRPPQSTSAETFQTPLAAASRA